MTRCYNSTDFLGILGQIFLQASRNSQQKFIVFQALCSSSPNDGGNGSPLGWHQLGQVQQLLLLLPRPLCLFDAGVQPLVPVVREKIKDDRSKLSLDLSSRWFSQHIYLSFKMYYLSSTFHSDTASSSFSHLYSGKVKSHRINPEKEKYKLQLSKIEKRQNCLVWSLQQLSY